MTCPVRDVPRDSQYLWLSVEVTQVLLHHTQTSVRKPQATSLGLSWDWGTMICLQRMKGSSTLQNSEGWWTKIQNEPVGIPTFCPTSIKHLVTSGALRLKSLLSVWPSPSLQNKWRKLLFARKERWLSASHLLVERRTVGESSNR